LQGLAGEAISWHGLSTWDSTDKPGEVLHVVDGLRMRFYSRENRKETGS